jgi:hypothetical protein
MLQPICAKRRVAVFVFPVAALLAQSNAFDPGSLGGYVMLHCPAVMLRAEVVRKALKDGAIRQAAGPDHGR